MSRSAPKDRPPDLCTRPAGVATYTAEGERDRFVKKIVLIVCCACAVLAFCGRASANVSFGITEDTGALGDPTTFYATLNDLGASENRIAISWDPANPTAIPDQATLDFWIPQATIHGVRLIFAVAPAHPSDITASPARVNQFAAFVRQLATTYPVVKDFVIGNEPNQPRFWQPQFSTTGAALSGAAYEPLLAASYDALKTTDPSINVIGFGLSPRGNDNPFAKDNISISPIRFLHDVGVAYRASKRTKPLMDELGFHPYPNQYIGKESVTPIDEGTQAQYYSDIVRFVRCDYDVRSLSFFHLIDERDLDRWQSGLLRIDKSHRASYDAVKTAIQQTGGTCALTPPGWVHTTGVTGGTVQFSGLR